MVISYKWILIYNKNFNDWVAWVLGERLDAYGNATKKQDACAMHESFHQIETKVEVESSSQSFPRISSGLQDPMRMRETDTSIGKDWEMRFFGKKGKGKKTQHRNETVQLLVFPLLPGSGQRFSKAAC